MSDALGHEVATLVNEVKQPGTYTVQFSAKGGSLPVRQASASGGDAGGLSSGVYFYRLHAGRFSALRKMLLMK